MKNCNYTLVGTNKRYKNSYDELIRILKRSPHLAYDILYSKDYNRQTRVVDKLSELKEQGKRKFIKEFSDRVDIINGCAEINTSGYTTQSFIDSGLYIDQRGKQIMPVLQIDDYLERMRILYENKGLSKDEISTRLSQIKNNWKRIAEDGRDLHKILLKQNGTTTFSQTEESTKNTSFFHLSDVIKDEVYPEVYKQVFQRNGKYSKEYNDLSSPQVIKNINLSAKLIGSDETITAHIDYLIVGPDGSIEVYNIKSSNENPSFWDQAKIEKYTNEFALMQRILQYNGIDTSNIRFNVIPIVLEYDGQFNNITSIKVHNSICYSHKGGKYIMYEAFNRAKNFISSAVTPVEMNDSNIDSVNYILKSIFPKKDIKAQGIIMSAEDYIDRNWKYWINGEQPDSGYRLNINGEIVEIKSSQRGSKNKELVEYIKKRQEELIDTQTGILSARGIISQFKQFRRFGIPTFDDAYMSKYFAPYFEKSVVKVNGEDKYNYIWEIINNETLTNSNILMFKNTVTGQVNTIILSNFNLDQKISLNGNENILGYHMSDMQGVDHQGRELMKATYGNIETMRALVVLNELLPSLGTDIKIGDISVVGGIGSKITSQTYPVQLVLPNLVKAIETLNSKETTKISNNFEQAQFISPVELLINNYWDIMQSTPSLSKTDLDGLKEIISGNENQLEYLIDGTSKATLASAQEVDIIVQRLEELINKLTGILKNKGFSIEPGELIKQSKVRGANGEETLQSAASKMLIDAMLTLDRTIGIVRLVQDELSTFDKYFARPQNISDSSIRITSKLFQDAIHSTMSQLDPVASEINNVCLDFYKKVGYTKAQNSIIGNQVSVFTNMFVEDSDDLIFKNPYTDGSLSDDERSFLKKMLFEINKVRFSKQNFPYKDENSKELLSFIDINSNRYFLVPLEKASESTKWSNPTKYFEDFKKRTHKYVHNPMLFFKETYENILSEEEEASLQRDIQDMQAYNPFTASDKVGNARQLLLRNFGKGYFETNIQNIVIDYLYRNIQEQEMNKMLLRARGIQLYLRLAGEESSNPEKTIEQIRYIDDYLKYAVFGRSIMNEDTKEFVSRFLPFRRMLTKAYIALNPVGAVRDIIGGFVSNTVRALTKYQTDIGVSDVMWAYQYVIKNGVNSVMDIDLLDKLNSKYLISNINIENQQSGYKTNTEGITNPSNLAYSTMKKPDYLNRMVLFIAKLKHDGSIGAYSVSNGQLVYNWRNDKRFNLLASNDKSNLEKYNYQKGLYLSLLKALNEEDPSRNLDISLSTELPEGYTLNQIEKIKLLGDTIYGSYNRSTKAKYEEMAIGQMSGIYSTWMNGIYDVYLGKRRESSYETYTVQKRDDSGNLLWVDENGNITTQNTGVPYLADIPLMVQGVFRTLNDVLKIIYHTEGGFQNTLSQLKTQIWENPSQRRNIIRALSDLLATLLISYLIGIVNKEYKEHKKEGDGKDVFTNALTELLYKGSISSGDELMGPLPMFDYVMNNTKPASWQYGTRTVTDALGVVFGDKAVGETLMKQQALLRSFQDTYRMYQRDTMNGVGEG